MPRLQCEPVRILFNLWGTGNETSHTDFAESTEHEIGRQIGGGNGSSKHPKTRPITDHGTERRNRKDPGCPLTVRPLSTVSRGKIHGRQKSPTHRSSFCHTGGVFLIICLTWPCCQKSISVNGRSASMSYRHCWIWLASSGDPRSRMTSRGVSPKRTSSTCCSRGLGGTLSQGTPLWVGTSSSVIAGRGRGFSPMPQSGLGCGDIRALPRSNGMSGYPGRTRPPESCH